ncbi:nuclear transport factor 2 family protein [Luteimonas saliphila]|uniref:nuclear transport factor 2 family protein n=1 Tax=Luteimonas saliphila TaxID=2804919 RepID=UPI001EE1CA98|nr:nuclear transport factor 2 family protein [Luteimonas saliphila]
METRIVEAAAGRGAGAAAKVQACFRATVAGVFAASLLLSAACSRGDPEAALRQTVEDMQAALEKRDAAAMQQHLAEDFIGNGGLDRDGARRLAAAYLLRHRDIGISAGPLRMEMADTHAVVRFTAMLRGGSGRLLPDTARVYDVETGWRLVDGDWKLASARWTPAL